MKTIMIVDEEPEISHQLQSYINQEEITIKTVSSSRKALDTINEDESISLLLINTKLPDKESMGYFSITPDSKLITDISDENNFLIKPFSKEEFLNFINKSLE